MLTKEIIHQNKRKLKNKNNIIVHDTYTEIILEYKNGTKVPVKVDNEDVSDLLLFRWSRLNTKENAYAYTTIVVEGKQKSILMHKFILNYFGDLDVDHKNGDKFDNRKSNLRICTHQNNGTNRKLSKNNKSKYKGVSWYKRDSTWEVKIMVNYKDIFLGRYKNLEEAIKVRIEAEEKYFGEFRRIDSSERGINLSQQNN